MHTRWLVAAILLAGLAAAGLSCRRENPPVPPPTKSEPAEPPLFEDATAASGIAFTYRNGEDSNPNALAILESLGGGAALIDYDGDGLLDVYLPGGGHYAGIDKKDIVGYPGKLYRNLGNGRFLDVTAAVGLDKLAGGKPWFYSHGAAVADYDRDGWADLLVTGWGAVALFKNVPDGKGGRRFVEVTASAGLDKGITWATSAAWGDLDGDGFPDLYVCQYVDWSWANHPHCTHDGKTPDVCPPKQFNGLPHKLYRNTGKGSFLDVSKEAGLLNGGPDASKGLGVLFVDVDGDGKPDIYVANDTTDNFLYLNKSTPGKLRFEEVGMSAGVARDDHGMANGSMGLDAGDPERTGLPSLWVSNYEHESHALYRNASKQGRPGFDYRTAATGIAAIGQQYVGWGTAFLDADLDGWEDLFVSNGHAVRYPTGKHAKRRQLPVFLLNKQGKFRQADGLLGDYAKAPRMGRGVAFGDLDNDGRTDLVLAHMNEPVTILRGVGGKEHGWLGVQLVGRGNACVVGARAVLEVGGQGFGGETPPPGRKLARFVKGGGSYASSGDRRLIFGLGTRKPGRLTVTWPDGSEERFDGLAAGRYHRIVQGEKR
jgi:hypothetical protein